MVQAMAVAGADHAVGMGVHALSERVRLALRCACHAEHTLRGGVLVWVHSVAVLPKHVLVEPQQQSQPQLGLRELGAPYGQR